MENTFSRTLQSAETDTWTTGGQQWTYKQKTTDNTIVPEIGDDFLLLSNCIQEIQAIICHLSIDIIMLPKCLIVSRESMMKTEFKSEEQMICRLSVLIILANW